MIPLQMKRLILAATSAITIVVFLLSFSPEKNMAPAPARRTADIIDCPPVSVSAAPISDEAFKKKYGADIVRVRKNVYNLTTAELNAIKVGIYKMRALPYTDPTSWAYQAAIHGTTMNDNLPSWNTCHLNGESDFFFSWHRMYLYFFERILRAKSGREYLTLPYWDTQANPSIPPAYRENSPVNPLYDATRNSTMNNGGSLPSTISTAYNNSFTIIPYYSFQNDLNGGPHGAVHNTISGNMAFVTTAAQDPVFWLHHSNVDRLWERWLGMCNGRANPTDATWLNKSYTFFDENGTAVTLSGRQIVEVANQLRYRYEGLPQTPSCTAARPVQPPTRETLVTKEAAVQIDGRSQRTGFAETSAEKLDQFVQRKNRTRFNFNNSAQQERLIVTFEGITVEHMPEGAVEVYLNLPEGATPSAQSNHFAGLLDLFTAEHHARHSKSGAAIGGTVDMDATRAAQALGLSLPQLREATLSFYVRGASLKGVDSVTRAQLTIKKIKFSLDEY
jgi:hypothetical protein